MFDSCTINGRSFAPARFCAPLVGYTHSAFRRLVAELGGCGAIWTEMLAPRQVLHENFTNSPWVRRRPREGMVVFQLMLGEADPIERVLGTLQQAGTEAIDINLGCNARSVRSCAAGTALFEDSAALKRVAERVRRVWPGLLTAKLRLGREQPDWQPRFAERVQVLEGSGVEALTLHPRFSGERFKRRARHEWLSWAASLTRLPVIANGDLAGPHTVQAASDRFQGVSGIMIGRMAIARPWIFASWNAGPIPDPADVWQRMCAYIAEDFRPEVALRRIQMFAKYFAVNFKFGHQFRHSVARAPSLVEARSRGEEFLSANPPLDPIPTVAGL